MAVYRSAHATAAHDDLRESAVATVDARAVVSVAGARTRPLAIPHDPGVRPGRNGAQSPAIGAPVSLSPAARTARRKGRTARAQRSGVVLRAVVRGGGELLMTGGLVVLLFVGYMVWGKAAQVDAAQDALDRRLEDTWGGGPGAPRDTWPPLPGSAVARMHIPKLDKRWVVVHGVSQEDIKDAPGHFPKTAGPGQVGNFSVAGHRSPSFFWDLDLLKPSDPIVVEDAANWYVYTVTEARIVWPSAVDVVGPVPGKSGARPTEAMLTLVTCYPKWDNYQRLIIHAKVTSSQPKNKGRPAELAGQPR